jgi:hypothetical protein
VATPTAFEALADRLMFEYIWAAVRGVAPSGEVQEDVGSVVMVCDPSTASSSSFS